MYSSDMMLRSTRPNKALLPTARAAEFYCVFAAPLALAVAKFKRSLHLNDFDVSKLVKMPLGRLG